MSSKPTMSREARHIAALLPPLRTAEARQATSAAVEYLRPELIRDGEERFRVLGVELAVSGRRAKDEPLVRRVDVVVVDYLNARHVRVSVEKGRVVEVRDLEGQPAFSSEEIDEAMELAAEAPDLRPLARRRSVFVSAFAPGGGEPGTRRIGLHFVLSRGDRPALVLASAVVDLVARRLVEHEIRPAGKGGSGGRVR